MTNGQVFLVLLFLAIVFSVDAYHDRKDRSHVINQTKPVSKYDNPNFIRDRYRDEINKQIQNQNWEKRFHKKFHPSWMDYCDPYHCNDYHKPACGLNRNSMKFKWFQSGCHVALHNFCSVYRGSIKYDTISAKWCTVYVMHLREGCPKVCHDDTFQPVCGLSSVDNHVVLFKNKCAMDAANCRTESLQEYEEVNFEICSYYV